MPSEYNESGKRIVPISFYLEAAMKNNSFRLRTKLYPILWSVIIMISVYLLIRYAALSFSSDIGQAKVSLKDAVISNLYSKVMESGSSLIRYTANSEEEAYAFPISLVANEFALEGFVKGDALLTAKAQEYSSLLSQNLQYENGKMEEEKEEDAKEDQSKNLAQVKSGIGYYAIASDILSKEYILTNGALYDNTVDGASDELQINYSEGDLHEETEDDNDVKGEISIETVSPGNAIEYTREQLNDISFLVRNFYIVDQSTKVTEELFDAEKLLGKDMTIKQDSNAPQILIYHTHSQEAYIDSRKNKQSDTVVGVGSYLTQILEEQYGYNVIHDTTTYDIIDGVLNRNKAYNMAEDGISKILEENPTIEVVIDLHRDGADKRSTIINGEETAQIMLFNGLSRNENGPITYLDNPNLQDNLAFSLQLQLKSLDLYPGLFYKNYLKCWRYNLHVRPKSLLIELGTDKNTLQSAKNAMVPLAKVLDEVLQGNGV
jgi:stage II sporulation protein P